jgi:hypothetical protein
MNIFFLSESPEEAAKYHCNKHVLKMIVESWQMLSTAHWFADEKFANKAHEIGVISYPAFLHHPCTVWARGSKANYRWLADLGVHLCHEYYFRWSMSRLRQKVHKLYKPLKWLRRNVPDLPHKTFTYPPQIMPNWCKVDGHTVMAYRQYYVVVKAHEIQDFRWGRRIMPYWFFETTGRWIWRHFG